MDSQTRTWRWAGLLALLLFVSGVAAWMIKSSPQEYRGAEWAFGEAGNQLFRADQIAHGRVLYRDMECQYGPLPIYAWSAFSLIAGNTVAANLLFHTLLSLVFIGALYWWATGQNAGRRVIAAVFAALVTVVFARTMFLHLLAFSLSNVEYFVFERMWILGMAVCWRPPEQRGTRDMLTLIGLCTAWQLTKVGGALFGLAAFVCVDMLWMRGFGRGEQGRAWWKWWVKVAVGCLAAEVLRCALFVSVAGWELGLRQAWPLHVAREYSRTWLTLWAGPKHFILAVLPIVGLVVVFVAFVAQMLRAKRPTDEDVAPIYFQGAAGAVFFLLAAMPRIGYLGHEWLIFGYQWPLLLLPLILLRRSPVWGLVILLLIHVGPLGRSIKEIQRVGAPVPTESVQTSIGPLVFAQGDARAEFLRTLLKLRESHKAGGTLIINAWGGGGWYVIAGETHPPRNIFFSSPLGRTENDDAEFDRLLADARLVLIQADPGINPKVEMPVPRAPTSPAPPSAAGFRLVTTPLGNRWLVYERVGTSP